MSKNLEEQIEQLLKLANDIEWEAIPTLAANHDEQLPDSATQPYQIAISNITGCTMSIRRAASDIKEIYNKCQAKYNNQSKSSTVTTHSTSSSIVKKR